MFSSSVKSICSKSLIGNSVFKSTLLSTQVPFQAALLKRNFARHFDKAAKTNVPPHAQEHIAKPFSPFEKTVPPTGPSVDTIIKSDVNLNSFMSKIYSTTGMSIAGSLTLSYFLAATSAAVAFNPFLTMFGGLAMSIGGIVAINRIPPEIVVEKNAQNQMVEKWVNPFNRKLAFSAIIAGSGVMIAPFMKGLLMVNPGVIPMAAALSLMTMGGASLYAMYKPLGQFKAWESTLYGTLIGLIGMNVISLITMAAIGPNIFSLACSRVDMYVGLGLFAAFQALDTHLAVQAYKEGNYDHLMHVVNFFLNFKNIFIRIASILGFRDD